jgi:hypothetical protein
MSQEVFALEGRDRCPQRSAGRTTIVRSATSWNQRKAVSPSSAPFKTSSSRPYTFRTHFSQSTFCLQLSSAQALASKSTQIQKIASVHVFKSERSRPQLSSTKPKRVIITHLKAVSLPLQSIVYRLRNPYCTALFCTVPRNRIFSAVYFAPVCLTIASLHPHPFRTYLPGAEVTRN